MPLEAGEHIGPYEVLSPLGKGGMGEVYRARDNRLRREVALKMLPDAAAHDADSLARFDRETRAVAALNHPNILAIHDTGSVGAVPYAVTELLEGETLADRLRSGPLNPAKALNVAIQIADGLAAAHARGIIHRDNKPDNIFLMNDGRAKILDFGIARIEQPARSPGMDVTGRHQTSSQFLVGTAGYMSPEQVRGKSIDPRTDIFSLGATIYEMLAGRRAFSRDTPVETLGAVLRDDPMKYAEAEKIPEELRGFVVRSLEKDPADRYQSVRDLLLDLRAYQAEQLRETADRVRFRSEPPWRHRRTRVLLRTVGAVVIFLVGLYAGSCWQRGRGDGPTAPPPAASR